MALTYHSNTQETKARELSSLKLSCGAEWDYVLKKKKQKKS